jgi:Fe-S cluster assembly protein SufD
MGTTTAIDPKTTVLPLLEGGTWPGAAEAFALVNALPVPGIRTEAWKYTRVGKLFRDAYRAPVADAEVVLPERLPFPTLRLVFVNGVFHRELSDELWPVKGVVIGPMREVMGSAAFAARYVSITPISERLFSAMNTASPTDGLFLHLHSDCALTQPIHVLHITQGGGQLIQPRDLILVDDNVQAEVIFEHVAAAPDSKDAGTSLVNIVREFALGEGAALTVHKLQHENNGPAHICQESVSVEAKGRFSIDTTTLEGSLVRNDLNVSLAGPEAHAELNGAYLLNGTTHCDNHTYIGHDVPDCTSDELYKGIVTEKGTGVFNGKVYVKQDAQRTRAYQSNANILQGEDAKVYTKPELEIYADDVKCSHGCTIGRLDEKGLFYLRSRGVSEAEARRMLSHAFMTDVLERITNADWRKHLATLIDAKLEAL